MQLRWSHAVMYVHDTDLMVDFYTNVLGFEVADRGPLPGRDGKPSGNEIIFLSQVATDHHQLAFITSRQEVAQSNSVNHFAFKVDQLDEVKEMARRLKTDGRGSPPAPVTHGNAWSIYFQDPENNGIEVFCDTPFHVAQPQGGGWDMEKSEADLIKWTRATFDDAAGKNEFGPIDDYYERRRVALAEREAQQ